MDNGNLNEYDNGSGNRNGNQGGNNNNQGGPNNQSPRRQSLLLLLIAALVTLLCMSYFMKTMNGLTNKEIPYNQFVDMIEKDQVESVEISDDQITITPKQDGRGNALYETPSITYHTGKVEDERIEQAVEKVFDLRPAAIIRALDLRKPIYRATAAYGHMGREDLGVAWEKTNKADELKAALEA